jgi:DNA-binding NtrC family response regulator
LLRVLEERVFEQVGGERTREFAGRVIALTNQSLEREVAERRFRKDLYYRLNVIAFTVPPLREHPHDVPALSQHFVRRLSAGQARPKQLSRDSLTVLARHDWPGNVRELRNVLERGIALCDSEMIEPKHLNLPQQVTSTVPVRSGVDAKRLPSVRKEAERTELLRVLEENNNNRTRAARNLGISRSAFYKRLEVLGLS